MGRRVPRTEHVDATLRRGADLSKWSDERLKKLDALLSEGEDVIE